MRGIFFFFGRLCLTLIFILSAVQKILDWQGTEVAISSSLNDWMTYLQPGGLKDFLQFLVPWSGLLLALAFAFELIGGLLVLFNIRVRFGAFLLMVFLIPATLLFSHFWFGGAAGNQMQLIMFLKNLSIFGGLLLILAYGKSTSKKEEEAHTFPD